MSNTKHQLPPQALAIGVDLGGTNIDCGLVDPSGHILARTRAKTQPADGRDAVVERIIDTIETVCDDAEINPSDLGAIGVGAPGPVDPRAGEVLEAPNLRWQRTPLRTMLAKRYNPDIFVENDVNVAVFGEMRCGSGRGATDLIGAWIGTGVGAAIVLAGRVHYGKLFSAGEIGHTILMPGNAPGTRSVEHNCSRSVIVNRLVYLIRAGRKSIVPKIVDGRLDKIKSRVLAEAYRENDPLTVEIVNDAADRLGVALANAATLLSLERVILGGGLVEALGELFVDRVRQAIVAGVYPTALKKQIEIVASELKDDAGIVGAGLLALHHLGV